jgi:hypothetical protein
MPYEERLSDLLGDVHHRLDLNVDRAPVAQLEEAMEARVVARNCSSRSPVSSATRSISSVWPSRSCTSSGAVSAQ